MPKKQRNHEELVCDCKDGGKHETEEDQNGDTVIECSVCHRFLKFPPK